MIVWKKVSVISKNLQFSSFSLLCLCNFPSIVTLSYQIRELGLLSCNFALNSLINSYSLASCSDLLRILSLVDIHKIQSHLQFEQILAAYSAIVNEWLSFSMIIISFNKFFKSVELCDILIYDVGGITILLWLK